MYPHSKTGEASERMEPHSSARMEFDRLASRRLFLILLLLVVGVHLVLLADHRLPRRHRTRLHYELQYALLSGSAHPGCVPLWMPFASHGTVSNWALFETSGLVLSPLMLAGPALVGADFQICFHLGVLAEELVLLIGCWMLSRRFFRSPLAAFFTTASALGSAFWLDEMSLNLHAIFALPLLLELLHRHFDDGSRKAMLLAANLAAVQALGGPLPAGLVTPISAAIYFAARTVLQKEPWTRKLAWGPLLMGASALLPVLVTASWGAGALVGASELVRPGPGDAIVYSGLGNPLRYLDLFLGAGPSLDWSIYCGALTVGLALAAAPPSSLARLA